MWISDEQIRIAYVWLCFRLFFDVPYVGMESESKLFYLTVVWIESQLPAWQLLASLDVERDNIDEALLFLR